eukprot:6193872-Pleurochrysis_carterae.AAC.2
MIVCHQIQRARLFWCLSPASNARLTSTAASKAYLALASKARPDLVRKASCLSGLSVNFFLAN